MNTAFNRYGLPGGILQEFPPHDPGMPQASMTDPAATLVPARMPPEWLRVPDRTTPEVTVTAVQPPPLVQAGAPPPSIIAKPETVLPQIVATPQAQVQLRTITESKGTTSPVNTSLQTLSGWSGPMGYGKLFGRDAQRQCAKFKAKLRDARAGRGFLPNGLFGQRIPMLQAKVQQWCGQALTERQAFEKADQLYMEAMAAGDAVTTSAIEQAVEEQIAANNTTGMWAAGGIALAGLGLMAYVAMGGRK